MYARSMSSPILPSNTHVQSDAHTSTRDLEYTGHTKGRKRLLDFIRTIKTTKDGMVQKRTTSQHGAQSSNGEEKKQTKGMDEEETPNGSTYDCRWGRDIVFIAECILGAHKDPNKRVGRPGRHHAFLYDIVNNIHSGLDVDKLDYFVCVTYIYIHGSLLIWLIDSFLRLSLSFLSIPFFLSLFRRMSTLEEIFF